MLEKSNEGEKKRTPFHTIHLISCPQFNLHCTVLTTPAKLAYRRSHVRNFKTHFLDGKDWILLNVCIIVPYTQAPCT
jgi:hypothetical protein